MGKFGDIGKKLFELDKLATVVPGAQERPDYVSASDSLESVGAQLDLLIDTLREAAKSAVVPGPTLRQLADATDTFRSFFEKACSPPSQCPEQLSIVFIDFRDMIIAIHEERDKKHVKDTERWIITAKKLLCIGVLFGEAETGAFLSLKELSARQENTGSLSAMRNDLEVHLKPNGYRLATSDTGKELGYRIERQA